MTDIYSHPQYLAFIDRIREQPEDDLPRLVCADWLEARGEAERAEFIRCQVAKARLERESGGKLPVRGLGFFVVWSITGNRLMARIENDSELSNHSPKGSLVEFTTTFTSRDTKGEWEVEEVETDESLNRPHWMYTLRPAPPCPQRDRWRELAKLEGELAKRYGASALPCDGMYIFDRGFIVAIHTRGADWIEHSTEILKRNPVRKVAVTGGIPPSWYSKCVIENLPYSFADNWPGIEFTFEPDPTPLVQHYRDEFVEADLSEARDYTVFAEFTGTTPRSFVRYTYRT